MTQTPFKAGPPIEALPQEAPRRRGRPPGSRNKSKASLKTEIGGTLTVVNFALAMTPLQRDALDPAELEALTNAIDEQCKESPAFRKYVEYAVKTVSGGGSLVGVVAIIGARRAARHGILPQQIDAQLGQLLALTSGKPSGIPTQPAGFDFGATAPEAETPPTKETNGTESPLD
jgi:hypothetical protein